MWHPIDNRWLWMDYGPHRAKIAVESASKDPPPLRTKENNISRICDVLGGIWGQRTGFYTNMTKCCEKARDSWFAPVPKSWHQKPPGLQNVSVMQVRENRCGDINLRSYHSTYWSLGLIRRIAPGTARWLLSVSFMAPSYVSLRLSPICVIDWLRRYSESTLNGSDLLIAYWCRIQKWLEITGIEMDKSKRHPINKSKIPMSVSRGSR
jgi:hypothetical protein